MKLKKILSLLLGLAAVLSLCACGQTRIEAYDTAVPLDFDAAWAKYDPETPVFYIDGETVTWREFFYQLKYFTDLIAASEGVTVSDWGQTSTRYADSEGHALTYGTLVMQNTVNTLVQYHALHKNLTEAGILLGKDALDSVEEVRRTAIEDKFGGDEQAFIDYLESMYCTEELWMWFNQVDALYAYDGFNTLYGKMGSDLSDEEVMTYAQGDPNGGWTEYVQIKQIYLYDGKTAEAEETTDEPAPTEKPDERAADIMAALDAADDPDGAFDKLYDRYNENDILDVFKGGRCVYEGDVDDAVYQAALELEEYEYTDVSIDGGTVVILRVPIDPDAGVYYDEADGTVYSLRYYAAWQDYSNIINGEGGWIASAQRQWAEGFGNLTLADLFSESEDGK